MYQLLGAGTVFLVIAIVLGLFGFGVFADDALPAEVFSGLFLVLATATFWWAWMNRTRSAQGTSPNNERTVVR